MKKTIINSLTICTLFFATAVNAQVGVGVPAENIHPSAELEVKSTTKGFLPPRMTKAERDAIVTPAAGLLIYQTDGDENNTTTNIILPPTSVTPIGNNVFVGPIKLRTIKLPPAIISSSGGTGATGSTSLSSGPGLYYYDGTSWKNVVGAQGATGAQGVQGETGAVGAQGIQGEVGIQGIKGDIGETGAVGAQGETGAVGPKGDTGAQGITGEQGPKGDKGEQGLPGNNGVTGYPFNPIQFATTTLPSGTKSYYYTILLSQATTISGLQTYLNGGVDPIRCGIYRGRIKAGIGYITLVGQTNLFSPFGSGYLRVPITAVSAQNLSFDAGEYITIAFHSSGSTNVFYNSAPLSMGSNTDIMFSGISNYANSGFPAILTSTAILNSITNKICFELY